MSTGRHTVLEETLAPDSADHNPPPCAASGEGLEAARDTFTTAGKIVKHWGHVDGVGMLAQMGALPPMG
jgi:hypothetical protein